MTRRAKIEEEDKKVEPVGVPIHLKYRPKSLKEILGQGPTVKSLEAALSSKNPPHCYLFTGPAGTGKTTLARIGAERLGIDAKGITEIDAASNSGIDEMRAITSGLRYNGFGDSPNKAIILNECQGLSKQAWDSLLTTMEEPPAHVYFFLTSTNPEKIPKAIVTRCSAYHLNPLRYDDVMDLLEEVTDLETYETGAKVLKMIAAACEGSARQALTMLAKVHAITDLEEVAVLLRTAGDNAEVIELARALVAGKLEWSDFTATLKNLDAAGIQPESIRLMLVNYINACLMGSKNEKGTMRLLDMLECFMRPAHGPEKMAPVLLAFGRYIYP